MQTTAKVKTKQNKTKSSEIANDLNNNNNKMPL